MNIYQCQKKAQDIGFDKAHFAAFFPSGLKKCTWLDAYMGFFKVEGLEGFLMVDSIDEMFPTLIVSEPFLEEEASANEA
jgi:hypothetical protein